MKEENSKLLAEGGNPSPSRSSYRQSLLPLLSQITRKGRNEDKLLVPKYCKSSNGVRGLLQSWIKNLTSGSKIQGIFIALCYSFFMAARNILAQLSTVDVSPFALVAMDRTIISICCLPYMIIHRISFRVSTADGVLLVTRGVCSAVVISSLIAALEKLPVGDASAIQSLAAIPAGVWGALFLGERFGSLDVMCALLGTLGFSLISKPTFVFSLNMVELREHLGHYGLSLLSAFSLSFIFPISRVLLKSKLDPFLIVFWFSTISASLTGALALIMGQWSNVWCSPSLIYVVFMGGCAFFANVLMVLSLLTLETFEVAILYQSTIVFSYVLQVTLLSVIPNWLSLLGAAIIIFACIIATLDKSMKARSR